VEMAKISASLGRHIAVLTLRMCDKEKSIIWLIHTEIYEHPQE